MNIPSQAAGSDFWRTLVIATEPAALYAALTTPQGLRAWWTRDCDVATEVGGTIALRFGETRKQFRVEALVPGQAVHWLCTQAHIALPGLQRRGEWVGTRMVFRLTPAEAGGTRLDFEHIGLRPEIECFEMCERGWDHFLASLQACVETGTGTPFKMQTECVN